MIQQENLLKCQASGKCSRNGNYVFIIMSTFFEVAIIRMEPLLSTSCSAARPLADLSPS